MHSRRSVLIHVGFETTAAPTVSKLQTKLHSGTVQQAQWCSPTTAELRLCCGKLPAIHSTK